ncbi:MAG: hypothetical protein WCK47_04715 [bacterium]
MQSHDKNILRELAKRYAEIAHHQAQIERSELWRRVNRLERTRAPINFHVEEFCWLEILPDAGLQCVDPVCRGYEKTMRRRIWEWENLDDDHVIDPVIEYAVVVNDPSMEVWCPKRVYSGVSGGTYNNEPTIRNENDLLKICMPDLSYDRVATERSAEAAGEIFAGILTVRPGQGLYLGNDIFDRFCEMRGMENVFMDMIERPEWVHAVLGRMTDHWIARLEFLEQNNLLRLNHDRTECYNGGFGVTDQLPSPDFDGVHVRLKDCWGFAAAQSAVSISPEMHDEFAIDYDARGLDKFGLNCYGCCETFDKKPGLLRKIPNLRRVSVSEWNNFVVMADALGDKYIYSVKPTGIFGAAEKWEPEAVERYLKAIFEMTKGCVLEIVCNTISTCRHQPQRLRDWTRIAKRLAMEYAE